MMNFFKRLFNKRNVQKTTPVARPTPNKVPSMEVRTSESVSSASNNSPDFLTTAVLFNTITSSPSSSSCDSSPYDSSSSYDSGSCSSYDSSSSSCDSGSSGGFDSGSSF